MKHCFTLMCILLFAPLCCFSQYYTQYFDGADTLCNSTAWESSLCIEMDTSSTNVWQIGSPQKTIFNSSFSPPNVLITDTINELSGSFESSFQYTLKPEDIWGILAVQWEQKLDMEHGFDGGMIEFSNDAGTTWQNAFDNPYVYNFYGYDEANVDTLQNNQLAFTGTDSTWKDIWLCYDMSWMDWNDSIMVKHTYISDSSPIDTHEGWMIDNMMVHITITHTVNEVEKEKYMTIAPNPASDRIYIETKKLDELHLIEGIKLRNMEGKVVQEWGVSPTKFFIDVGSHPPGVYLLEITTNIQSEKFRIIIE